MYGTYCRLNITVGASAREVIRAARRKLARTAFRREQRKARHDFYRAMLKHHADARELCREFRL